jgi:glycine cleavage system aminomethyltransferase T
MLLKMLRLEEGMHLYEQAMRQHVLIVQLAGYSHVHLVG